MRRYIRRCLSFMLVVVMILSLMPTSIFASTPTGINKGLGNGDHLVPSNGTWQNMGGGEAGRFLRISLVEFPNGQDVLNWLNADNDEVYKVIGSINVYNDGFKVDASNNGQTLSFYTSTAGDYLLKGAKKTLEDSAANTKFVNGKPEASNWVSCEEFASLYTHIKYPLM